MSFKVYGSGIKRHKVNNKQQQQQQRVKKKIKRRDS